MWHGSAGGRAKPQFWGAGWLGAEWRQEPNLERSHKRSSPTSTLLRWQFPCHIHRAHFPPCIPFLKAVSMHLFTYLPCVYMHVCVAHMPPSFRYSGGQPCEGSQFWPTTIESWRLNWVIRLDGVCLHTEPLCQPSLLDSLWVLSMSPRAACAHLLSSLRHRHPSSIYRFTD